MMLPAQFYAAAAAYGFRPRRRGEDEAAYFAALIEHVESRDYAAAHELRLGRRQAEWTASDVEGFQQRLSSSMPTTDEFGPGVHSFATIEGDRRPATEASLLALADRQLDVLMALRRKKRHTNAEGSVPILSSVLLDDGHVLHANASSSDRIAIVKALVRTHPVFGFCVVFDAFMHGIVGGAAVKRDAFVAQVGTREMRVMKRRPYRVVAGRAEFDSPPPPDVNIRETSGDDPYASIFVSVPPVTGAPS